MKKILILILLSFSFYVFSQTDESKKPFYEEVDEVAVFPGGISAFRELFSSAINVNKVGGEKGKHRTEITLIVEQDGTLSDVKADGRNVSLNVEAVLAIKKISDKWKPASIKGIPVRSRFSFPVTLNLE